MGSREIEEAMAKAVEEDLIRTAAGLSIPSEVIIEGYEVIKAFAKYLEAADQTGKESPLNAIMCLIIDMAVYRTAEIDFERMNRVKTAWIGAREYLIRSITDAKCLTCGREDKECL